MAVRTWNGLELCSGVGMLGIGVKLAIEHVTRERAETVCHVERDAYAAAALVARMGEASLGQAPIWDDLTTFDGTAWRGCVDWLAAGAPCQPWSAAGKQRGTADERWLWPAIARIIRDSQPTLVFLENVPGLVSGGGLHHVLDDLAEMGFAAEWGHLRASAVGANHRRERVFLVAYSCGVRGERWGIGGDVDGEGGEAQGETREWQRSRDAADDRHSAMANSEHGRPTEQEQGSEPRGGRGELGDAIGQGSQGRESVGRDIREKFSTTERAGLPLFAPGPGLGGAGVVDDIRKLFERDPGKAWRRFAAERDNTIRWIDVLEQWPELAPARTQEEIESTLRGLADGLAADAPSSRADQLRCVGNGVVALQAAACFVELMRRLTRVDK